MPIEYKLFDLPDVKMLGDDGAGEITGYASTFSNFDDVGERVVKGAFAAHLPAFLKDGFVAIGHNWSALPIAIPLEASEDDHGLFVRAAFHSTSAAQDARTVIRERLSGGKSVKLLIGYEVLKDEYTDEGRLLKDVRLFEWSYVTVPANQQATVTTAKAADWKERPLVEHADAVEAAITLLQERLHELKDRRAKAGRVLSEANRSRLMPHPGRLREVADDLDALLIETDPSKAADPQPGALAETRQLYVAWQAQRARLRDLGVTL
jgi:HK97 family phage prohead protease